MSENIDDRKVQLSLNPIVSIGDILADLVGGLSHDELFEFIKRLDEYMANLDFSIRLHRYFLGIMVEHNLLPGPEEIQQHLQPLLDYLKTGGLFLPGGETDG